MIESKLRPLAATLSRLTLQNTWLPGHRCQRRLATVASHLSYETVEIPCRSSGTIKLDIYPPSKGTPFSETTIYLPSGPFFQLHSDVDAGILSALRNSASATLVRINYRAGGPKHWFPNPIHDVLTGYDWIKDRITETGHPKVGIGVCGQLLGGSLGATLALTESRARNIRVTAAALNNPIIDWVVADREALELAAGEQKDNALQVDGKAKRGRKKKKSPGTSWTRYGDSEKLSAATVLAARKLLFKTADGYFDSFASPIHFLRTPGCTSPSDATLGTVQHLTRKSPRVFPPSDSDIFLPKMRVSSGNESVLLSQLEEFVDRLGKSLDKAQHNGASESLSDVTDGDSSLHITSFGGPGLWLPDSRESQTDLEQAVHWLQSNVSRS
jgi:acetyl esterase/lipase